MLLPTHGRVGGGRRNSVLLINAPAPPMGKPVSGSRGPAALNENPRNEVGPPAYRRSGSGINSLDPGTESSHLAVARVAREHIAALIEAVEARIGKVEAIELRLGAERFD